MNLNINMTDVIALINKDEVDSILKRDFCVVEGIILNDVLVKSATFKEGTFHFDCLCIYNYYDSGIDEVIYMIASFEYNNDNALNFNVIEESEGGFDSYKEAFAECENKFDFAKLN